MKFSSSVALVALTGLASAAPAVQRRQDGTAAPSAGLEGFGGLGSASPSGLGAADGGHFHHSHSAFPGHHSGTPVAFGAGSAGPTGAAAKEILNRQFSHKAAGGDFSGVPSGTPQSGFPAQQSGFPAQHSGFPAQHSGFPAQQSGAPAQQSGAPFQKRSGFASEAILERIFGSKTSDESSDVASGLPSGTPAAQQSGFPAEQSGAPFQKRSGFASEAILERLFGKKESHSSALPQSGFPGSAAPSHSAIAVPLRKRHFGDAGSFPGGFGGHAAPSGGPSFGSGSASPSGAASGSAGSSSPSGVAASSGSVAKVAASGVSYSASGTGSSSVSASTGSSSSSSTNSTSKATTTDAPFGYASTNGGTTGGEGGTTTTVSSLAEFTAAATADEATVIYISGEITGATQVKLTSDTSIIGLNSESSLVGIGLYVKGISNVILRNFASSKVLAENGDAIGVQASTNVWCDHLDLSSDLDNGKDYYDGLLDVTHASEWVTISNVYFHDHYKASLVGHSDSNADEDTGHLHVTYANNYWSNISSRTPSIRFGTGHIYNSYFEGLLSSGIDTRDGAQVLVESNVFSDSKDPLASLYSDDQGYAVSNDNDFGSGSNTAPAGTLTTVPYEYTLLGSANVKAAVVGTAGNTLTLG